MLPSNPTNLALLTDLYQLTMAYGYWKLGRAEQEAVFHLFFRKPPFRGGYAIAAGLGPAIEFLADFAFDGFRVRRQRHRLPSLTPGQRRPAAI
jgi:nicotinic acid phosphoribosyltransferase